MEFLPEKLDKYIEDHTSPERDVLKALNRETHIKVQMPQMLSGHVQGQVLRMFSQMIKPQYILEIGTFTGYSAICLAAGLQENGKLVTLDINDELEEMVRKYFSLSGLENKIDYRLGNALDIIPQLDFTFDIVFIDADKQNYSRYFDLVIDKVKSGGFILADNVLWSGKVVENNPDKDTKALLDFNAKVQADERVENALFPVRDGIMVMRKK
ncbi:MAG: O-methyltransferase [Sphingobacteriales bacterium]|nr:MAG: O-methyltransferase [Sphingobacteriales bacterium]